MPEELVQQPNDLPKQPTPAPTEEKAKLEVEKLRREVAKLDREAKWHWLYTGKESMASLVAVIAVLGAVTQYIWTSYRYENVKNQLAQKQVEIKQLDETKSSLQEQIEIASAQLANALPLTDPGANPVTDPLQIIVRAETNEPIRVWIMRGTKFAESFPLKPGEAKKISVQRGEPYSIVIENERGRHSFVGPTVFSDKVGEITIRG